jgi:hypothetical protein
LTDEPGVPHFICAAIFNHIDRNIDWSQVVAGNVTAAGADQVMPSAEVAYSRLVLMLLTYPEIAEVESPAKDAKANLISWQSDADEAIAL